MSDPTTVFYARLGDVKREGMDKLINFLEKIKFHELPASLNYHNNFKGGLILHSLSVYNIYKKHLVNFKYSNDSLLIITLLHDICKIYDYKIENNEIAKKEGAYIKGHAKLSVVILENFIKLTEFERTAIKYHMGYYGCNEGNCYGEYSISELKKAQKDKFVKLLYLSDEISSQIIE